jgi:uncharacterized Fe-S radical SAM superfamily protein PflX
MGQYRPQFKSQKYPQINRKPSMAEMAEVKIFAEDLGILFKPVS